MMGRGVVGTRGGTHSFLATIAIESEEGRIRKLAAVGRKLRRSGKLVEMSGADNNSI